MGLRDSLKHVSNAKKLARQLSGHKPGRRCSHSIPSPTKEVLETKREHRQFEAMYEGLTGSIHQFSAQVGRFQDAHRPIFERVYVQTRKLLFDFFGTAVDVS